MRIAFVTWTDPRDPASFSGSHLFMLRALEEYGHLVDVVGPLKSSSLQVRKVLNKAVKGLTSRGINPIHSWGVAQDFAKQVSRRIVGSDVVFAPASSTSVAALTADIPIVYFTDLTFKQIHQFYPKLSVLWPSAVAAGHRIETAALQRSTVAAFPSKWTLRSAIEDYGLDSTRGFQVHMGANLEVVPDKSRIGGRALQGECKLLFVGVDWERKGGEIALETLRALRRKGIPASLTVCGCVPPVEDPYMSVIPFLRKDVSSERARILDLFCEAHFLVLPTRGDAFPMVLAEASACGLPCFTCDVGGVTDVVHESKNGFVLPLSARGPDYALMIAQIWEDPGRYATLEFTSRCEYDNRLNWTRWATRTSELLSLASTMSNSSISHVPATIPGG